MKAFEFSDIKLEINIVNEKIPKARNIQCYPTIWVELYIEAGEVSILLDYKPPCLI